MRIKLSIYQDIKVYNRGNKLDHYKLRKWILKRVEYAITVIYTDRKQDL